MNKKGAGLILGLVVGVAFLVTTVIIAFVLVSNISTIESDTAYFQTDTISNESGHIGNTTGTSYNLSVIGKTGFRSPVLTKVYNQSSGLEIALGNFTVSSAGLVQNTTLGGPLVLNNTQLFLISYTYQYKQSTVSTENLRANFTSGVNNVSGKIPTVLLIAAVVLILGVLVLLWTQYQKMGMGSGGEGGNL